jgi:ribosomal protein S12 methylthiotransferase accessory factor
LTSHIAGFAAAADGRAAKSFTRGTHRTRTPEATLDRVAPFARQMGITRLANVTGLDRIGIPVAIAVRPNSRSLSVSQGKGLTLSQAMASAMMEAIEIFHGENLIPRTVSASHRQLSAKMPVVAPGALCGTGLPLADDAEIPWIEGYDLLNQRQCWVPWEIVHTDYTVTSRHTGEHFLSGTNGLASGNHLLEALNAGICELIERDAIALWNARGLQERANCHVDLASVHDADCGGLLESYSAAGIRPRIWDVTSDVGIATFICDVPADGIDSYEGLRRFRGSGCHVDRGIALARALTEAAQVRLTYISGNRDDLPEAEYRESQREKLGGALLDALSTAARQRSFFEVPNFASDDLAGDLRWQLERLTAAGITQVIAVDLTRADVSIPVVRIVIPGLEWTCTHPDYVPGPRAQAVIRAAG